MSFEPKVIRIAVALLKTDKGVAIVWNNKWESFVLPMTKIGGGAREETAEQAAVRALAEIVQAPCQAEPDKSSHETRQLQLSNRDGEIKDYQFTVVPVQIHPDFATASIVDRPIIFASTDKLQAEEYQPMSSSVKPIIDECVGWSWISV